MSYIQIVLLVLQFLLSMKSAESAESFAASSPVGVDGEILKKLWENREEIIAFVLRLMDLFNRPTFGATADGADSEVVSLVAELKGE